MNDDYTWLGDLKVGDEVILEGNTFYDDDSIESVTRITPAQVHVGHYKFRKSDGLHLGADTYRSRRLIQASPDQVKRVKTEAWRRVTVQRLNNMSFKDVSNDKLWRIINIINEPTA